MRGDAPLAKAEVIQRYQDGGTPVYRTDYGGSIRVTRDDAGLVISRARDLRNFAIR